MKEEVGRRDNRQESRRERVQHERSAQHDKHESRDHHDSGRDDGPPPPETHWNPGPPPYGMPQSPYGPPHQFRHPFHPEQGKFSKLHPYIFRISPLPNCNTY